MFFGTKRKTANHLPVVLLSLLVIARSVSGLPIIIQQPASQVVATGSSVTFSVSINGVGPFGYQWLFNGISMPNQATNIIFTVAGKGTNGYSGDGGAATNAMLNYPAGVAVDNTGNLFIVDASNHRIRMVGTNGIISTVAGNGGFGYSGDGGDAINANLSDCYGVAVDRTGNLFIADSYNNRIRMVGTNGIISTVAGNGTSGFSGDGSPATNAMLKFPYGVAVDSPGNLYIADPNINRIRKVGTNGIISTVAGKNTAGYSGDGGAATNAMLNYPVGIAVDSIGNLYIVDSSNHRIRKVGTNGIISTVAGNGVLGYSGDGGAAINAMLNYPTGVAVDNTGNLFIVDDSNHRIRRVGTNGIISTVAGKGTNGYSGDGGAATNAMLDSSSGVAVDFAGNLFIADSINNRIRKVNTTFPQFSLSNVLPQNSGNYQVIITGYDGCVTSSVATLFVAAQPYIITQPVSQITQLSSNTSFAVSVIGAVPLRYQWYFTNYSIITAGAYAQTLSGFVYGVVVTNGGQGYTTAPAVSILGGGGSGAVAFASVNNGVVSSIIVSNTGSGYTSVPTVQIESPNRRQGQTNASLILNTITANDVGNYYCIITNTFGSSTSSLASLNLAANIISQPQSVAVWAGQPATFSVMPDAAGPYSYQWLFNGTNIPIETSNSLIIPMVTSNNAGNYAVLVSNLNNSILSASATLTVNWISQQPTNILVTNGGTSAFIVKVNNTGSYSYQWLFNGTNLNIPIISTVAGNGVLGYTGDGGAATNANISSPSDVAVDSSGNLFISDNYGCRIRKVGVNGIISKVAGTTAIGYSGDGGPATSAKLNSPTGIAVDSIGNLYIVDSSNQRIRKVGTNGIISTVAGNGNSGFSGDGGPAISAKLNNPTGVAVDNTGNLFIVDDYNHRIRMVGTNGIISTVAGNGAFGYSGDGGAATNAMLFYPSRVVIDSRGNLYFSDSGNDRIRRVGTNGIISTVAGKGTNGYSGDGGAATNAMLWGPIGVAVDFAGNVYFADAANDRIRKVETNGIISTVVGKGGSISISGDRCTATNATLSEPHGVAVDSTGNLFISDWFTPRILKFSTNAVISLPNLTLVNVSTQAYGNYQVVITSASGSITSSVATLNPAYPPSISQQPLSRIASIGGNAVVSVSSSGTDPFGYQWWMVASQQSNATAVPVVINGFVLGANMTSGGAGYLTVPNVQIVGGSGSGAGGYAVVSNRMVSAITVTNAGSGYATPPTIQIAAPSAISLPGQTNTTLTLLAVANTDAGNYFVVVTNNFGSVTSSVASLIIAPSGYNLITGPVLTGGNMQLSFIGLAGTNYALDQSFTLSPANWVPVVTNPADVNGVLVFTNAPNSATNNFWRVRSVP